MTMRRMPVQIRWSEADQAFVPFSMSGDRLPIFFGLTYGVSNAAQLGVGDDPSESIQTFADATLVTDANGGQRMKDPSPAKGAKLRGWVWVPD